MVDKGISQTLRLRCYFCGKPISKRVDAKTAGFIEFCDQEAGPPFKGKTLQRYTSRGAETVGGMLWPGCGDEWVRCGHWHVTKPVALFTHEQCGPDVGYSIPFDRLDEDWDSHLSAKQWYFVEIHDVLMIARRYCGMRRPQPRIDRL